MTLISRAITGDFWGPIGGIRFDLPSAVDASRAPVPKTSVHEYAKAPGRKHEVGFAGKLRYMQAVAKPFSMEKTAYNELRLRISAPDLPHIGAAPFGCEAIGHNSFFTLL